MQANIMIFYPHYCYDCQMQYFGVEENKARPCPRCGSTNAINGPLCIHEERCRRVAGGK